MPDLNDLTRPVTTDTEPNVLDTIRAHIIRAATWSWATTAGKVAGLMSATTAAVSGGRSLRLYRRNDANTADEEVVSLPGVSVGGNAASATTASALQTARSFTINGVVKFFSGLADVSWSLAELGVPSNAGVGANGTWPISISGNAATASDLLLSAFNRIYPVGTIYTNSANSTNPGTLLGFGTWVSFGSGRVLIGVNAADPLFDTAEETGGSKDATLVSHTHTAVSTVNDPGHVHNLSVVDIAIPPFGTTGGASNATSATRQTGASVTGITVVTELATTGSSSSNANLQPYITVYMWKRTA